MIRGGGESGGGGSRNVLGSYSKFEQRIRLEEQESGKSSGFSNFVGVDGVRTS